MIGVVIVSRGLEGLLDNCIRNVGQHEVVVVDNASPTPYLKSRYKNLLRFDTHQSFAAASNAGVKALDSKYILFLNNDVFLNPNTISQMLNAMEEKKVSICGARLVFPDDTIQHCGVVFSDSGPYHLYRKTPSNIVDRSFRYFQAVTGACLLVTKELFDSLGGFDESYPFGLEDIDFCLRARQIGAQIGCINSVDSLHFESMTPGRQELDRPSRKLFMDRWKGRHTLDG